MSIALERAHNLTNSTKKGIRKTKQHNQDIQNNIFKINRQTNHANKM